MFLTVLIVFFSIITLLALHEFGHFIIAKKFGVRVDEFGIGYPPRIFGKKYGETLYSLNLLPLGAFVKIYGDEAEPLVQDKSQREKRDPRSFTSKPIWQRALILFGGVAAFWLIAWVLLSFVFVIGVQQGISDEVQSPGAKVLITAIASESPAQEAGLKPGDTIVKFQKVIEVQDFIGGHKGEEIILTIQRGKEIFDVSLVPRISPPEGEGAIGIGLARIAIKSYPWYEAPLKGAEAVATMTYLLIEGLYKTIAQAISGTPTQAQLVGPIGLGSLMVQAAQIGLSYYLQFIAMISIYLAIFNLLPIPALDGGRLLFLGIEKIKGRPINQLLEQKINTVFFFLLIGLMIFVTIKDIGRLF
ncbi:RIP metalloprotease RseP [Candidatus Parcubacteria bacterium]|nr:RIP metalloprotease RseP [Candidatus Parcubacteria bacterium]